MSVTQTVYHAGIPVDLAAPSRQQIGASQFFYGDNRSHVFTALVGDTDHPETGLRSGAVTGAVLRHDGVTVVLAGEKGTATVPTVYPNGKAANATACSVTLPQECFAVPGPILITIKLVDGETVTSVLNIGGTVIRTETDSAVDPGEIIPDVSTLAASARAALAAAEEANTAAAGADTAAQAASSAATDAGSAAESAYAAVDDATAAANEAYDKAQVANTAAQNANSKAQTAIDAANRAAQAAYDAQNAAGTANTAAQTAGTEANRASAAASAANAATNNAFSAAQQATGAAQAANTAASGADTAAQAANAAATAAQAAMAGAVRFDAAQTLTEAQSAQARTNIGAASAGDIPTGAVRYDEAQTLTDAQKAQALGNIGGASTGGSSPDWLYDQIMGSSADWSVDRNGGGTLAKTGRLFTLEASGSSGSTWSWTPLTGTTHRVFGGDADAAGDNTMENTDYVTINPVLMIVESYSSAEAGMGLGLNLYVNATSAVTSTNIRVYVRLRRYDTEAGEYVYSSVFSGRSIVVTPTSGARAYNMWLAVSQDGYQTDITGAIADYEEIAIYLVTRSRTIGGTVMVEPAMYTIPQDAVNTVTGATPTITAAPGARYVCSAAYVETLSFTPSASGICSVRFVSGTTPTVLTLPNTVKMPDWWTGVEASRTYEISIADGVYGAVTSWA